jgi:hypothetical protein
MPHPTIELLQEFKQSILTLSPKGADMPFHQHLSSWLYLAHGRKFWLISEPHISPAPGAPNSTFLAGVAATQLETLKCSMASQNYCGTICKTC